MSHVQHAGLNTNNVIISDSTVFIFMHPAVRTLSVIHGVTAPERVASANDFIRVIVTEVKSPRGLVQKYEFY